VKDKRRSRDTAIAGARPAPKLVVLVGEGADWPPEVETLLGTEGYRTDHIGRLEGILPVLAAREVQAVLVAASPLAATDLLLLRRLRETWPHTAIVVLTRTPTDPDLKRAFESGATAFLSWPASTDALRRAIEPGPAFSPSRGGQTR
jgi:DNA-binding response OmpR family regulator